MEMKNDEICSWCFHAKELFINNSYLKYFLSGQRLIFHNLINLLLEQGIPTKYKEIWELPNSNCDQRVINPKVCIQDYIGKMLLESY